MASITDFIPDGLAPTAAEVDVLLELAYLVTAVDGRLTDEELSAFAAIAARLLHKAKLDPKEVDDLLERFADCVETSEIEARVRQLAPALPEPLHEVAYTLSLALAFVDHDPSEAEDRLHAVLGTALGLDPSRRAALSREITLDGKKAH